MTDSFFVVKVKAPTTVKYPYNLDDSWVPLPPGITAMPAAPVPVSDPIYGLVVTPTALLRPYQEKIKIDAVVKVQFTQRRYEYAMTVPDRTDTFKIKAFGVAVQHRGDFDVAFSPKAKFALADRQVFQTTTMRARVVFDHNVYDADAIDYIDRVEAVSGNSGLETGVKDAINAFIVGLKDDGNWTSLDGVTCILMGAKNANGAIIPLKSSMPTQTLAGGPTFPSSANFNRKTGLQADCTGNGEDDHIRTGVNANRTGAEDGNHLCIKITSISASSGGGDIIAGAKNAFHALRTHLTSSYNMSTTYQLHSAAQSVDVATHLTNRTSNSTYTHNVEAGGTIYDQTNTVTGVNNGTTNYIAIFAYNSNESGGYTTSSDYGETMRANFYSVGSTLTDTTAFLERIADLETAIAATIP
jgi:hypothetical protein